jgi:hypothetical protein
MDRGQETYVKILENTGEDLRFLVWKIDPLALGLEELASTGRRKERRQGEDILVGCKEPPFLANGEGHNRRGQSTVGAPVSSPQWRLRQTDCSNIPPDWRALIERSLQFRQLRGILIRLLQLDNLVHAIGRSERALEHGCGLGGFLTLGSLIGMAGKQLQRVTKRVSRLED